MDNGELANKFAASIITGMLGGGPTPSENPIKKYEHGYPCMFGDVVGRIIGESDEGSWGEIKGERMWSIPLFSTPHGSVIKTGVLFLSEITEDGMKKLLEYEDEVRNDPELAEDNKEYLALIK